LRVAASRQRLALITPTRLTLGAVLLAVAFTGESPARSIVLAFMVGAVLVAFAALSDRRGLLRYRDQEPEPLPPTALRDPSWRVVLVAAYPSTFGVAVLAVIALAAGNEVLGAVLAGAVAGLGLASAVGLVSLLVWERERAVRLYVGPHGRRFVD
jgi:hypothetical protein